MRNEGFDENGGVDAGDPGASQADGLDAAGHDGSAAGGVHSHMHTRAAGQMPGTG